MEQLVLPEVNEACLTLLQELGRFQERMYLKDPVKATTKKRYLCGLRELYNAETKQSDGQHQKQHAHISAEHARENDRILEKTQPTIHDERYLHVTERQRSLSYIHKLSSALSVQS